MPTNNLISASCDCVVDFMQSHKSARQKKKNNFLVRLPSTIIITQSCNQNRSSNKAREQTCVCLVIRCVPATQASAAIVPQSGVHKTQLKTSKPKYTTEKYLTVFLEPTPFDIVNNLISVRIYVRLYNFRFISVNL